MFTVFNSQKYQKKTGTVPQFHFLNQKYSFSYLCRSTELLNVNLFGSSAITTFHPMSDYFHNQCNPALKSCQVISYGINELKFSVRLKGPMFYDLTVANAGSFSKSMIELSIFSRSFTYCRKNCIDLAVSMPLACSRMFQTHWPCETSEASLTYSP